MRRIVILGVLLAAAVTSAAGVSTAGFLPPDPENAPKAVAGFLPPDPENAPRLVAGFLPPDPENIIVIYKA